jgi:hypothetical protein
MYIYIFFKVKKIWYFCENKELLWILNKKWKDSNQIQNMLKRYGIFSILECTNVEYHGENQFIVLVLEN